MSRSALTQAKRSGAACFCCLLLATLAVPLSAQVASQSKIPARFGYDKAHEITLDGTIQAVVSRTAPGVPPGLHLMVAGTRGAVDAHLGPYLSKEVKAALRSGAPVQIIGATARVDGKSYLLARQVIVDGRTITVRSANGFLGLGPGRARSRTENTSRIELNGGAR